MTKVKQELNLDVLSAARDRINNIINNFDEIWIAFSGGKDSLVTLEMFDKIYKERGIKSKLNVFFRDEEFISDDIIEFVEKKMNSGRFNFRYYVLQQYSQIYILGETKSIIQWDKKRKHIRPIPEFAIQDESDIVHDETTFEKFIFQNKTNRIAIVIGVRADESLTRLRSIVNNKHKGDQCYIAKSSLQNVRVCKPIYDWTEDDIFKYLYDERIDYCDTYNIQMFAGKPLRVASAIHPEAARQFHKLRGMYPTLYQQLVNMFPELTLQERYHNDYDMYSAIENYQPTWNGIYKYIIDSYPSQVERDKILKFVKNAKAIRDNKRGTKNFGGYPLLYVFKTVVKGSRHMIPPRVTPTKEDLDYENGFYRGKSII